MHRKSGRDGGEKPTTTAGTDYHRLLVYPHRLSLFFLRPLLSSLACLLVHLLPLFCRVWRRRYDRRQPKLKTARYFDDPAVCSRLTFYSPLRRDALSFSLPIEYSSSRHNCVCVCVRIDRSHHPITTARNRSRSRA